MVSVEIFRWFGQSEIDVPAYGYLYVIHTAPVRVFGFMLDNEGRFETIFVRSSKVPTQEDLKDILYKGFGAAIVEDIEYIDTKEISEAEAQKLIEGLRVFAKISKF